MPAAAPTRSGALMMPRTGRSKVSPAPASMPASDDQAEIESTAGAGEPVALQQIGQAVGLDFDAAHQRQLAADLEAVERGGKQILAQRLADDAGLAADHHDLVVEKASGPCRRAARCPRHRTGWAGTAPVGWDRGRRPAKLIQRGSRRRFSSRFAPSGLRRLPDERWLVAGCRWRVSGS